MILFHFICQVIEEILDWIEGKDLLTLRCISSSWKEIIAHKRFSSRFPPIFLKSSQALESYMSCYEGSKWLHPPTRFIINPNAFSEEEMEAFARVSGEQVIDLFVDFEHMPNTPRWDFAERLHLLLSHTKNLELLQVGWDRLDRCPSNVPQLPRLKIFWSFIKRGDCGLPFDYTLMHTRNEVEKWDAKVVLANKKSLKLIYVLSGSIPRIFEAVGGTKLLSQTLKSYRSISIYPFTTPWRNYAEDRRLRMPDKSNPPMSGCKRCKCVH